MGKFNYTTSITGYRSASVRRAIYQRSSPKDCCQRPQYRMGIPTPAPRPPTPRPPPAPTPTPTSQKIMVKQNYRQCLIDSIYHKYASSLENAKAICMKDNSCNCIDNFEELYNFYTSASLEIEVSNRYDTWIYTFPPEWKQTTTKKYECWKEGSMDYFFPGSVNNAKEWCKKRERDTSYPSCKCLQKDQVADGWFAYDDYRPAKSSSSNLPVYIYTSDPILGSISAPIIESSDNVSSKLKILCLHGGEQSVASFRVLLTDLINELSEFEFVFAETPEENYLWIRDPPGGKDEPTTDPDWASRSIDYLNNIVEEKGPFYGILGYSQGGAMALTYLAYLQKNNMPIIFEKIILFNSYFPETHLGLMSSISNLLIEVPIVKIVGEKDYYFYELGKILHNQLDKNNTIKLIEDEQLGHYPPGLEYSSFEDTVKFIKK